MGEFDQNKYAITIKDVFHDICIDELSYRGKIIMVRAYAEIYVRKLLNYKENEKLMLGDDKVKIRLQEGGYTESFLMNNLHKIQTSSNKVYHTRRPKPISETEWDEVYRALMNLFAYLFYKFFKNNKMDQVAPSVLTEFSLLPPEIRLIVLENLYHEDNTNKVVIEKLLLAKTKVNGVDKTLAWIEENKNDLQAVKVPAEFVNGICISEDKDWYIIGKEKVALFRNWHPLYTNFSEARKYYEHYRDELAKGNEVNEEFNSLMNFVFIGW